VQKPHEAGRIRGDKEPWLFVRSGDETKRKWAGSPLDQSYGSANRVVRERAHRIRTGSEATLKKGRKKEFIVPDDRV